VGDVEQGKAVLVAPPDELAQIQRVRLTGAAGVAGQEPGIGHDFSSGS
jgi:hypothetical protein